jgi:hypothetical protein
MTTPRTVAGQAAISAMRPYLKRALAPTILAIEAQAIAPYVEALREADRVLESLAARVSQTFNFRNFSDEGLVERLRFAKFDAAVVAKFFVAEFDGAAYAAAVRSLIERCNASALETLRLSSALMARLPPEGIVDYWALLDRYRQQELVSQLQLTAELDGVQARFGLAAANREPAVAAIGTTAELAPVS